VLRRPEVSSAIIGASRPEQVEENARASGVVLDASVVERVERALAGR
jgi:aryl-alcohol dehydrogenase-like predicted oxidoreductase